MWCCAGKTVVFPRRQELAIDGVVDDAGGETGKTDRARATMNE